MNSLDSFSAKLITNLRANAKEHAYVVTDKSVFRAGESVWFTAFLLNSASQKLSTKSRFVFADIVNEHDSVVKRVTMDAGNRQLTSRLQLPDSLPAGFYWLRAYTSRMALIDSNEIGIRPLYVVGRTNNIVRAPNKKATTREEIPTVAFYPEGNNIITGINSIVALSVTINGAPLSIDGYVKDDRETIATKFSTNSNGLGKFEFEPSGYRKYLAVINWQGKEISYLLPAFNFFGGQLSASKQSDGYKLRILLGDSIYAKDARTYVAGFSRDSLVFAAIGKGQCEVFVDDRKLPQGITTFYLFNKDFKPISERSVYVNDKPVVAVTTDKNSYATRDKVTLAVSVTDAEQQAIPAVVAVSVSDSIFSNDDECDRNNGPATLDNLFSNDNTCFNDEQMDLMMLTRANTYDRFSEKQTQTFSSDDDSLLFIKGTIVNARKEPAANKLVLLISGSGTSGFFATDTTDTGGQFCFPVENYPDSAQFAIQVKELNKSRALNDQVLINKPVFPRLKTPAALKKYYEPEPKLRQRVSNYYNVQWNDAGEPQLAPVMVTGQQKTVDYDESKRVSPYSAILTSKDLDGRMNVDDAILMIPGLQVLNGYVVIHGLNAMIAPNPASEPMIVVEGAQMTPSSDAIGIVSPVLSYLHSLNPKDIDFIEVLKDADAAAYGVRGANGVILINLRNKPREYYSFTNNMTQFYAEGISKPAVFVSPVYDKKDKKSAASPDYRSTIFWNGSLLTNDAKSAGISFYTSDIPSIYRVTVRGITIHGDIIYRTINIQSK
ncbi:MAG TPA: MG2 domain-containing protein [Parafilimonas sp.]|nr:MG2 domain-containing protein [Parafilimonas sp.]